MNALFNVGLAVAIVATVTSLGLALTISEIAAPLRRLLLLSGLIVVNVLLIPASAWGIAHLLGLSEDAAIGVTLAAIGSAGAAGLKAAQLSDRADLAHAVSIVVVLQLLNVVAVPVWAGEVVPGATISRFTILQNLVALVLVPLLVGLAIRARADSRAARWRHLLVRSANISLTVALVAGVAANRSSLVDLGGSRVVPASIVIVAFAVGIGMLVGGRDAPTRTASGLVSGMRFAALGLIIIGTQLDGRPSVLGPAIVFALVAMALALALALAIARWPARITEPGAA